MFLSKILHVSQFCRHDTWRSIRTSEPRFLGARRTLAPASSASLSSTTPPCPAFPITFDSSGASRATRSLERVEVRLTRNLKTRSHLLRTASGNRPTFPRTDFQSVEFLAWSKVCKKKRCTLSKQSPSSLHLYSGPNPGGPTFHCHHYLKIGKTRASKRASFVLTFCIPISSHLWSIANTTFRPASANSWTLRRKLPFQPELHPQIAVTLHDSCSPS